MPADPPIEMSAEEEEFFRSKEAEEVGPSLKPVASNLEEVLTLLKGMKETQFDLLRDCRTILDGLEFVGRDLGRERGVLWTPPQEPPPIVIRVPDPTGAIAVTIDRIARAIERDPLTLTHCDQLAKECEIWIKERSGKVPTDPDEGPRLGGAPVRIHDQPGVTDTTANVAAS